MKFVVTGAAGHVSKPLTELLLKKGHEVTVVRRCELNGFSNIAPTALDIICVVPMLSVATTVKPGNTQRRRHA